jgi:hypothetical protein
MTPTDSTNGVGKKSADGSGTAATVTAPGGS